MSAGHAADHRQVENTPRSGGAPIRLASGVFIHHCAGWYPAATGAFAAAGLDVAHSIHKSGGYATQLLRSGELDFVTVGVADPMTTGLAAGDVYVLASAGLAGRLTMIVVAADSDIRQPSDLRGKRIALQENTGAAAAVTDVVLPAVGLRPGDYQVKHYLAVEGYEALVAGEVDAAALMEVHVSLGVARGKIRVLLDYMPYDIKPMLLAASARYVDTHPAETAAFLDTYLRCMRTMLAAPDHTAAVVQQEFNQIWPGTNVSVDVVKNALGRFIMDPHLTPAILDYLAQSLRTKQETGLIDRIPDLNRVVRFRDLELALARTGWGAAAGA